MPLYHLGYNLLFLITITHPDTLKLQETQSMASEVTGALHRFERELASLMTATLDPKSNKPQQNGLVSGHTSSVTAQHIERASQSQCPC